MKNNSMLWRWLGFIFVLSFGALGYLGWQMRVPGDILFAVGAVLLAWYAAKLLRGAPAPSHIAVPATVTAR